MLDIDNNIVKLDSSSDIEANIKLASKDEKSKNTLTIKDLNKENIAILLNSGDTFAFTLLTICLIAYGEDTFKLDILTLEQFLKEDFNVELSDLNENKLSALLTALTTDYFFKDLEVFQSVCCTLIEGDPGVFGPEFDDPTIVEILWAMYEVSLAYDNADSEKYSPEIKKYVETLLSEDIEDPELTGLDSDEETYQEAIYNNVALLKEQLEFIGLKNLPPFPKIEIFEENEEV